MKNNKTYLHKLRKLCVLRERLVDKNGRQHYVYQMDEYALHGTYIRATGSLPPQYSFKLHACSGYLNLPSYLTFNL